jgi:para-aminobenzoate synthetase component 1
MYLDLNLDIKSLDNINHKLLSLSELYNSFCYLDSNNYTIDKYGRYEKIIAIGSIDEFCLNKDDNISKFEEIDNFINNYKNSWKFIYLNYKLKNYFEKLSSTNEDPLNFKDAYLFIPKFIYIETKNSSKIQYYKDLNSDEINSFVENLRSIPNAEIVDSKKIDLKPRITKDQYINTINKIRENIKYGDIYEMNFCQEFRNHSSEFDPISTFLKLKQSSPAPFSAYFKENNHYLISSSPERYIQKQGDILISQPIKGTARKNEDLQVDNEIKKNLKSNTKERAENIMIVDLVRNDLSKINGSKDVKVAELCEIYSFPHVHQMISTVETVLSTYTTFTDIIKSSFPMGSMTGAPKIRAMELIEKYESQERGLFSGSVGYIAPNGDFDLNVIIRSLLYNKENSYLSLSTGGAITYKSTAEDEYEESLLKAKAILSLL